MSDRAFSQPLGIGVIDEAHMPRKIVTVHQTRCPIMCVSAADEAKLIGVNSQTLFLG